VSIGIAVIGCGYWGPNLVRVLSTLPSVDLRTLCDLDTAAAQRLAAQYARSARVESDFQAVARDPAIDAAVVATPMSTHYWLGRELLEAGKHLLIEKPLATTSEECEQLAELADRRSVTLMVGHVFEYHPAVVWVKQYLHDGKLGDVYYVHSRRLNLGRIQNELNAMWSFAPHDVSILLFWLEQLPLAVSARGFAYLNPGVEDVAFVTLEFPGGICANLHLSWLDPKKVREMTVVGSQKMLVYDDVSVDAKIQVYDKGVVRVGNGAPAVRDFGEFQLQVRTGDLVIPNIRATEPLREECAHFVECIQKGLRPRSDSLSGLRVVRILEAAEESLKTGGRTVELLAPVA
jgi:predicted dehydrogenase